MIPKIIHLCWLSGDPYPPLVQYCIDSWKNNLPDYQIILWDKRKFNINESLWVKQAYENHKYAFAADYIRFYALYHYGGIYLDSDVEVLKSFNPLIGNDYILGEEVGGDIEAAVMGSNKGATWVKECLDYYNNRSFIKKDGTFDMKPVPGLVNKIARKHNMKILPYYFFSPKNFTTGNIDINDSTFCIHHFDGKWVKKGVWVKIKHLVHKTIYFTLGRKIHNKLIKIIRPLMGH